MLLLAAAFLGCLLVLADAAAQDERRSIPALTARVTDTTGTLDGQQTRALESELAALERRKGAQIGVLIVATTKPEDIAQYAIRVYDAWKLGRKGVDDGVLLVVAKDDHRVRIEVARGLEGAIPDAATARIIRDYVTPKFRAGDFYGGIHDAADALTKLVDGEALPPPSAKGGGIGVIVFSLLFCAFWAFFLRLLLSFLPGPIRGLAIGIAIGVLQWWWLQTLDVTAGVSLLAALVGAGAAFLIGFVGSGQKRGR